MSDFILFLTSKDGGHIYLLDCLPTGHHEHDNIAMDAHKSEGTTSILT